MLSADALGQVRTHWRARLSAVGIPLALLDRLFARADSWEAWAQGWEAEGADQERHARDLVARGRLVSAGEAFALAALLHHFGQLVLFHDPVTKDRLSRRREQAFRAAAPHLVPPARLLAVATPSGPSLHAYLRLPRRRAGSVPCVFVVPGVDSTKEEHFAFSNLLLERGMAAVCFDGPGQGETRQHLAFTDDYERHVAPLVREVAGDEEIDEGRLGVVGFSFGGYLALRVAAAVPEIRACAVLGGCYDLSYWEDLPALLKEDFTHLFGVSTWREAAARARRVSLEPIFGGLRCPLLVVHGRRDGVFPWTDAERMAARTPGPAELLIYDEGDHGCHNVSHRSKPGVADWLGENLKAEP
jgi:dipeptidyl aminopeptidase/acylaminoacyl peptidase